MWPSNKSTNLRFSIQYLQGILQYQLRLLHQHLRRSLNRQLIAPQPRSSFNLFWVWILWSSNNSPTSSMIWFRAFATHLGTRRHHVRLPWPHLEVLPKGLPEAPPVDWSLKWGLNPIFKYLGSVLKSRKVPKTQGKAPTKQRNRRARRTQAVVLQNRQTLTNTETKLPYVGIRIVILSFEVFRIR